MALINCSACAKEISDKASACPHCGAPVYQLEVEQKKLEKQQQEDIEEQENREERERIMRIKAEQKQKEEPLGNSTSVSIGWILGILLVLAALGSLMDSNIATTLIYFIGASFLLPPVRRKIYQKTQVVIPPYYRIGIVIGALFFAMIASERAETSRAEEVKQKIVEEQVAIEIAQKEKEHNEFKTNKEKIIHSVTDQIKNKSFKDALQTCNIYMKFGDKDLTPVCTTVKTEVLKVEQKEQEERAKKEAAKAAKAKAREEAELKASMGPRAWKLHQKHPEWDIDDCRNVAKSKYWIGMSTEMMVASLGRPNSAKPSNYGHGRQWQYCYTDGWFQCFYDQNDDGIIDLYN